MKSKIVFDTIGLYDTIAGRGTWDSAEEMNQALRKGPNSSVWVEAIMRKALNIEKNKNSCQKGYDATIKNNSAFPDRQVEIRQLTESTYFVPAVYIGGGRKMKDEDKINFLQELKETNKIFIIVDTKYWPIMYYSDISAIEILDAYNRFVDFRKKFSRKQFYGCFHNAMGISDIRHEFKMNNYFCLTQKQLEENMALAHVEKEGYPEEIFTLSVNDRY
jgi:hypothetical protein